MTPQFTTISSLELEQGQTAFEVAFILVEDEEGERITWRGRQQFLPKGILFATGLALFSGGGITSTGHIDSEWADEEPLEFIGFAVSDPDDFRDIEFDLGDDPNIRVDGFGRAIEAQYERGTRRYMLEGSCRSCGNKEQHLPHVTGHYHTVRGGWLQRFCAGKNPLAQHRIVRYDAGSAEYPSTLVFETREILEFD